MGLRNLKVPLNNTSISFTKLPSITVILPKPSPNKSKDQEPIARDNLFQYYIIKMLMISNATSRGNHSFGELYLSHSVNYDKYTISFNPLNHEVSMIISIYKLANRLRAYLLDPGALGPDCLDPSPSPASDKPLECGWVIQSLSLCFPQNRDTCHLVMKIPWNHVGEEITRVCGTQ